ncbi:MAG: molybdopterin cofactor-binding domain-containing protein [Halieaceae bacterium]|jgi:CO/xanthine dehydrogenase Mo-binding subunit|nr:molybdopterin cofactor-binding domain-containing protein [Halieaceae bacterium]
MNLSRRAFIKNVSVAGGALSLGFTLAGCSEAEFPKINAADFQPDAFLRITPEGKVIAQIFKAEMGQGVTTGILSVLAEEAEVDPASMGYEMAPPHKAFADPEMTMQVTGGSNSIRVYYPILRQVGATAKAMMITAAAQQSGTPASELFAENGRVKSRDGSVDLGYGELVATANTLTVPENAPLKSPADFKVIGHQDDRLDLQGKVDGSAMFGMDAPVEDALVAVVLRCPHAEGSCGGWDASKALQMPGVADIFQIDGGIAVVARNYWRARKAAEAVETNWQASASPLQSSEDIERAFAAALDSEDYEVMREDGEPPATTSGTPITVEYNAPFVAHATMEPQNATARPTPDGGLEVWVGTQGPDIAQAYAAKGAGLDKEKVIIHNTFLGGGFGRRAAADNVYEVAQIATKLGKPVKLVWSREDDMRHDFYRPVMKARLTASVSADGEVETYRHHIVAPSVIQKIMPHFLAASLPGWVPHQISDTLIGFTADTDHSSVEGVADTGYQFPHFEVKYSNVQTPMTLGFWRSVGHSQNAFVIESFVDELAHAAGRDPVEFRRAHLPEDSRQRRALDKVVAMANWGNAPEGRFQGVAVHESFHSVVAEVAEISLKNGKPVLEKIYCAVDCGRAVNPDIVKSQMESGIVFGLTAALKSRITIADGAVQQGNFDDYPMLRMNEVPEIEVAIIETDADPTGVGEPGTPPAAPALANALFAATGVRQRDLPLKMA